MSKRKNKNFTRATRQTPAMQSVAGDSGFSGGWGGSMFSGADFSNSRGFIYVPTVDTRRDLTPLAREEMTRRGRWLYENVGVARRAVDGITSVVVGNGIKPIPSTSDETWNSRAQKVFESRANSAALFSASGDYNFYTGQQVAFSNSLRDGEVFLGLGRDDGGGAQIAFYPSTRVGGIIVQENPREFDGIVTNAQGRTVAYNFYDPQTNARSRVSARHILHIADRRTIGRKRGVTAFSHAINHLLDISETLAAVKLGIKSANTIAFVLTSDGKVMDGGDAVVRALSQKPGAAPTEQKEFSFNDFARGGNIPSLPAGVKIETINDSRPHPNQQNFLDYLIRDISLGFGVLPDVLWDIAKAGGTGVRYAMADMQAFAEPWQNQVISQYAWPIYSYIIACAIESGELDKPKDSDWTRVRWIKPARRTIDLGRDGRMFSELKARGDISQEDMSEWIGGDWKELYDDRLREFQYQQEICAKAGVEWAHVFGNTAAAVEMGTEEPTEEEKEDEEKRRQQNATS